ncbi:hypothetical protein DL766_002834 [Monosporascus sp. MC13-8B]|uniref:IBR domain-containing protein n=1 Tax=Monosporascus cannonballus TaxID=155416 RepID=A0ABY0H2C2_9PEZI|nr:hypothetical protein DL762_006502 [Monosporascus cannonballus]RYO88199.1 hypothetical protein DL763_006104 [Monosporascus cannonballus]RYP34844.1 hypothetical protein DL766_002834 [Monosporascus sp. MC13-8B]
MPSVTHSPAFPSSKKRRRDDDGEVQMPLYGSLRQFQICKPANRVFCASSPQCHESQELLSAINNNERLIFSHHREPGNPVFNIPRKPIPLPMSKRLRPSGDHEKQDRHHDDGVAPSGPGGQHHQQRQPYFSHAHPEYSTPPISPQIEPHQDRPDMVKSNSAKLDPCHICHRKPTKKSDLDSFADCMGCGQRTCFVCIRQCQGWLGASTEETHPSRRPGSSVEERDFSASFTMHDVDDMNYQESSAAGPQRADHAQTEGDGDGGGCAAEGWNGRGHREVICSRCCVERGSEGDVVCLGCLAGMEGA